MEDPFAINVDDPGLGTAQFDRGGARDSMMLAATMTREIGSDGPIALRVRNISPGGLMAECLVQIASGERVLVEMRNIGEVMGTIAWVRPNRIGIAFDQEIDPKAARKPIVTKPREAGLGPRFPSRRPGLRIG